MSEAPTPGPRGSFGERFAIIAKALLVALVLAAIKVFVHQAGWEPIQSIPLLTALMGGVVFTLAILLAGTFQDFKESERIVGELATQFRRLSQDLLFILPAGGLRQEGLDALKQLAKGLNRQFADGQRWDGPAHRASIRALDRLLLRVAAAGSPQAQTRTVQVGLHNSERIMDRIGVIVETTFARAGYYLAAAVVVVALGSLLFTQIEPFGQGLFLFAFSGFLMSGLFLLIWDLDNPFAGHARISTHQMQQVELELSETKG